MKSPPKNRWPFWLVHPIALLPLAWLLVDAATNNLTFNPIQAITQRTGRTAIILLLLTLTATPINTLFGFKPALALRKPLGLYAFFYVSLHLLTFVVLDYGFNWGLIAAQVSEKRYVVVGFTGFLLLVPLAITSTRGWQKRLGKHWKRLHQAIYLVGALAVFHYLWLSKDPRRPLLAGTILTVLLVLRLPAVRRAIARARGKISPPKPIATAKRTPDTQP